MRKIKFLSIIFLLLLVSCSPKEKKVIVKEKKVIEVLTPQKFRLNSVARPAGINKTVYSIELPTNTIEWYYTIVNADNMPLGVDLAIQLGGKGQIDIKDIKFSLGTANCNIYLMDEYNKDQFINGKQFSYNKAGSRENFIGGILLHDKKSCFVINN
jgi:hypothetical protein